MDVEVEVAAITAALTAVGTPERADHDRGYLRSDLHHLGASVPDTRRAVARWSRDHPDLDHRDLLALLDALWAEDTYDLRLAAVELGVRHRRLLGPGDLPTVARQLRRAGTWALVDPLSTGVVADLRVRAPDVVEPVLTRWAQDDDLWVRRASLLAYLPELRASGTGFEGFAAKADRMLDEREFSIRKAIGWVLRDTGRRHPELVTDWLLPRAARASGLTVREATRHLPPAAREAIARAAGA